MTPPTKTPDASIRADLLRLVDAVIRHDRVAMWRLGHEAQVDLRALRDQLGQDSRQDGDGEET